MGFSRNDLTTFKYNFYEQLHDLPWHFAVSPLFLGTIRTCDCSYALTEGWDVQLNGSTRLTILSTPCGTGGCQHVKRCGGQNAQHARVGDSLYLGVFENWAYIQNGYFNNQWLDLRENLQETIDFPMKNWDFPVKFPLNQSIEMRTMIMKHRMRGEIALVLNQPEYGQLAPSGHEEARYHHLADRGWNLLQCGELRAMV